MSALLNLDETPEPEPTPSPLFLAGEIVQVVIDRLKVTLWDEDNHRLYGLSVPDRNAHDPSAPMSHVIDLRFGVAVARLVPADGQPQPGDVWRSRFGGVWFAVAGADRSSPVELVDPTKPYNRRTVSSVQSELGPLSKVADIDGLRDADT